MLLAVVHFFARSPNSVQKRHGGNSEHSRAEHSGLKGGKSEHTSFPLCGSLTPVSHSGVSLPFRVWHVFFTLGYSIWTTHRVGIQYLHVGSFRAPADITRGRCHPTLAVATLAVSTLVATTRPSRLLFTLAKNFPP